MKKITRLFRGISNKELEIYKKEIPVGKKFTSDIFMARKSGENVIQVSFNKKRFKEEGENNIFKTLKIKERYYTNIKPIKKFTKLGFID